MICEPQHITTVTKYFGILQSILKVKFCKFLLEFKYNFKTLQIIKCYTKTHVLKMLLCMLEAITIKVVNQK